jgi:hypothetical protein
VCSCAICHRARNPRRWVDGGWDSIEAALASFRWLLQELVETSDLSFENGDGTECLRWLIEGAPWEDDIIGFSTEPDGRGNYRFVAIGRETGRHPFSTAGALHGDFSPPKPPFDPDNPFGGLIS